jgi:hypothetical protein
MRGQEEEGAGNKVESGFERKENVLAHSRAGGFPTSFCPEGVMADMSWRRVVRFWKSCGQFGDQGIMRQAMDISAVAIRKFSWLNTGVMDGAGWFV